MKKSLFLILPFFLILVWGIFFFKPHTAELLYPNSEQFFEIAAETELTQWTVKDTAKELEGTLEAPYSKAMRYELYNEELQIRCQFLVYLSHAGTPGLAINLLTDDYAPLTEMECKQLLNKGLPELWRLASKLCSDPHAVLDLQEQMEKAYEQVIAPEQYSDLISYFGEWGAQCSGIYATARIVKQDADSYPMWYQLKLVSEREYNDAGILGTRTLSEVKDLNEVKTNGEETGNEYFIYGELSQIAKAGDVYFRNLSLPANMSFYQKAVLTDESGSLPVYIAPTALNQEELSRKRLHLVQMVQNRNYETCHVITGSYMIESYNHKYCLFTRYEKFGRYME